MAPTRTASSRATSPRVRRTGSSIPRSRWRIPACRRGRCCCASRRTTGAIVPHVVTVRPTAACHRRHRQRRRARPGVVLDGDRVGSSRSSSTARCPGTTPATAATAKPRWPRPRRPGSSPRARRPATRRSSTCCRTRRRRRSARRCATCGPSACRPIEKTYILPAHSRTTIPVDIEDPGLVSTDVSAAVTATAPIIAERAMYRSRPGQPFAAGSASAGVTAPALEWFLAEGATGHLLRSLHPDRQPEPDAGGRRGAIPAGQRPGLPPVRTPCPANGRFTIWVDDEPLPPASGRRPFPPGAVSAVVRGVNGLPIVVERTMWWPGPETTPDFWYESHNSPGATATALRWGIAGAEVGEADSAHTFLLIANATASAGQVMVRVLLENGHTVGRVYDRGAAEPHQRLDHVRTSRRWRESARRPCWSRASGRRLSRSRWNRRPTPVRAGSSGRAARTRWRRRCPRSHSR